MSAHSYPLTSITAPAADIPDCPEDCPAWMVQKAEELAAPLKHLAAAAREKHAKSGDPSLVFSASYTHTHRLLLAALALIEGDSSAQRRVIQLIGRINMGTMEDDVDLWDQIALIAQSERDEAEEALNAPVGALA